MALLLACCLCAFSECDFLLEERTSGNKAHPSASFAREFQLIHFWDKIWVSPETQTESCTCGMWCHPTGCRSNGLAKADLEAFVGRKLATSSRLPQFQGSTHTRALANPYTDPLIVPSPLGPKSVKALESRLARSAWKRDRHRRGSDGFVTLSCSVILCVACYMVCAVLHHMCYDQVCYVMFCHVMSLRVMCYV